MRRWDSTATYPVHEADVCQHEEVDLDEQPSFGRCIGWYAPDGDSKSMQEAHVEERSGGCVDDGCKCGSPTTAAREFCL